MSTAQDHIAHNRPPRVHIKYGVETHGAFVKGELPFIIGVMAGLSGKPETPLPPVGERDFKNVNGENFNKFMEAQNVRASFRVKDTLSGKADSEITVDLPFRRMRDFDPARVVEMVPALAALMREREGLDELWDKLQTKDKAIEALQNILKDPALMQAVLAELEKDAAPKG